MTVSILRPKPGLEIPHDAATHQKREAMQDVLITPQKLNSTWLDGFDEKIWLGGLARLGAINPSPR